MYTARHVVPLFIKACPEWETTVSEAVPAGIDDIAGIYSILSLLARKMVESYQTGAVDDFPKIFNTLELLIREGDEKARELVMIGFIEVLQAVSTDQSLGSEIFKRWLKEESSKSWYAIERFWKGKKSPSDTGEQA